MRFHTVQKRFHYAKSRTQSLKSSNDALLAGKHGDDAPAAEAFNIISGEQPFPPRPSFFYYISDEDDLSCLSGLMAYLICSAFS